MENNFKFKFTANEFIEIWSLFCQEHMNLYDLTCEEYVHLLSSDIDKVEEIVKLKNLKLSLIGDLDSKRKEIIQDLSYLSNQNKTNKINDIILNFKRNGLEAEAKQLSSLNLLLLDIIEKIQEQSKKNQIFLNKAILSLKDLKRNFSGKNSYTTYGANGVTRTNVNP